MNDPGVPNLAADIWNAEDREPPPSAAELDEAARLAEALQMQLRTLVLGRESFRRELREAVADGDRMIADLAKG